MPEVAVQTCWSMPPSFLVDELDEDFEVVDCLVPDVQDVAPPGNWADPRTWPAFPPKFFDKLGRAHIRWGHKGKSFKYAVNKLDVADNNRFAEDWVAPRLGRWLADRELDRHLSLEIQCGELALPRSTVNPG